MQMDASDKKEEDHESGVDEIGDDDIATKDKQENQEEMVEYNINDQQQQKPKQVHQTPIQHSKEH